MSESSRIQPTLRAVWDSFYPDKGAVEKAKDLKGLAPELLKRARKAYNCGATVKVKKIEELQFKQVQEAYTEERGNCVWHRLMRKEGKATELRKADEKTKESKEALVQLIEKNLKVIEQAKKEVGHWAWLRYEPFDKLSEEQREQLLGCAECLEANGLGKPPMEKKVALYETYLTEAQGILQPQIDELTKRIQRYALEELQHGSSEELGLPKPTFRESSEAESKSALSSSSSESGPSSAPAEPSGSSSESSEPQASTSSSEEKQSASAEDKKAPAKTFNRRLMLPVAGLTAILFLLLISGGVAKRAVGS